MNHFSELIKRRRSIRKFTDEMLRPKEVESLMKAALMSPASKSSNPWQFVLVEDKSKLSQLSEAKAHGAKLIADCTLAIVVLGDSTTSDVWIEDTSIASTVIQLQAEDLGLGSCWVQIRLRQSADGEDAEQNVRDILNIPSHLSVLSIIAIGRKAQAKEPHDESKLQWEKVHIESYKIHKDESEKK
ncbi:MAG: nitroreductase family protein [Dysgonamonadaceae bacterium]|jgi:nitroreductase|nr:nitroreductase family protein [Dysgonamonadaceae bacterium]